MTIEECYQRLGGDYAQVLQRLPSADLVKKFIAKFLDDGTFVQLEQAMGQGNREQAFRAAHTLKGVAANLGLERLRQSSGNLTEALRPESDAVSPEAGRLLEAVRDDYQVTVESIRIFLEAQA